MSMPFHGDFCKIRVGTMSPFQGSPFDTKNRSGEFYTDCAAFLSENPKEPRLTTWVRTHRTLEMQKSELEGINFLCTSQECFVYFLEETIHYGCPVFLVLNLKNQRDSTLRGNHSSHQVYCMSSDLSPETAVILRNALKRQGGIFFMQKE